MEFRVIRMFSNAFCLLLFPVTLGEPTSVQLEPNADVIRVDEGSNLTVNCLPENDNTTITSITWSHNERKSSGSTYYIQNVTQSDEGRLTCTAYGSERTNPGWADTFIRVLKITLEPTSVQLEPNADVIRVDEGSNLTVNCLPENDNTTITSITWSHNGRKSSSSTYYIQNVTQSDEGRLTCTAYGSGRTNPGWADTFIRVLKITLEVRLEPNTDLIRVNEGANLTVNCLTNASAPSVTWSHNGNVSYGSTFHIQNVTQSDEGRLTCTAQNGIGTSHGQADTFIVTMKQEEEPSKAETEASEDDKSKWTMVHTAAVVVGVVAVLIIVVLVMIIFFLYRKHGPVSMQKKWKSDDTEMVTATSSYSHQEDSDSDCEKQPSALPVISKVQNRVQTLRERQQKIVAASNPVYDKDDDDVVYDVPPKPRTIQPAPKTQNTVTAGKPPFEEDETEEMYENYGTIKRAKDQALQVDKSVCEDLKREGYKKDTAHSPFFEEEEPEEMYENFGTLERRKHQAEQVDKSEDVYQNFKASASIL